jgi:hypothetical protein
VIVLRAGRPWPGFYGTGVTNIIVPPRHSSADAMPPAQRHKAPPPDSPKIDEQPVEHAPSPSEPPPRGG